MNFSEDGKKTILSLSRNVLENLGGDLKALLANFELTHPSPEISKLLPCFVTLLDSTSGDLRGCIGCIETKSPLYHNVWHYTHAAATQDPRFTPLKSLDAKKTKIEISVLGPFLKLLSPNTIKIGHHGLYVRYQKNSGLLLAKVAVQYGWDVDTFMNQTCLKARLRPEDRNLYEFYFFEEFGFSE